MATQTEHRTTAIGVFENHEDAQRAIRALKDAGFREDQIGVASRDREPTGQAGMSLKGEETFGDQTAADETGDTYAGEGAAAGAAAGAGVGALWGLGIVAGVVPGIGPAIAGGTLAAVLSSLAAGAAAAGVAGALIGMGFSKEEAEYYETEFRSGRTVVTVHAGTRYSEAVSILQQHGSHDFSTRGQAGTSGRTNVGETTGTTRHAEHQTVDVPVTREDLSTEDRPTQGRAH